MKRANGYTPMNDGGWGGIIAVLVAIVVAMIAAGFDLAAHHVDCSTEYSTAITQAEVDALKGRCGW